MKCASSSLRRSLCIQDPVSQLLYSSAMSAYLDWVFYEDSHRVIVARTDCLTSFEKITIMLHSTELSRHVKTHKLVGALIDNERIWKVQVNAIIFQKWSATSSFSKNWNDFFENEVDFNSSVLIPHIDYCSNLWGKCPNSLKTTLDYWQCVPDWYQTHNKSAPSAQMFMEVNWLNKAIIDHVSSQLCSFPKSFLVKQLVFFNLEDCPTPSNIPALPQISLSMQPTIPPSPERNL